MKTIHHVVDVAAPARVVWAALTEPGQMASWWSTRLEVIGDEVHWTFAGDFNPVMRVERAEPERELVWRCVAGHDPWADNTFRFTLAAHDSGCRLRFWQEYATELDDDAYGTYNFNWGYYLESLRLLATTDTGKPFRP